MSVGYVYCLTIPRMEGVVKIGYTVKTMEERLKALDNTSCVEPFQVYYAGRVRNPKRVETLIHEFFKQQRIRANREYFEIDPITVKKVIQIAEASTSLGDDLTGPTAATAEDDEDESIADSSIADEEETPAPPEDEDKCLYKPAADLDAKLEKFKFKGASTKAAKGK